MKKTIIGIVAAASIALGFVSGHIATIYNLSIETDGDGDSAIVRTLFGQEYMYGINGYTVR